MTDPRLLVLDDDLTICQTISRIAGTVGFATRITTTAANFFEAFDNWQPTHIALDLIMPDMDGVEVLVELAQRHCRAHIIIVSGVGTRVLDAAARSAAGHGLSIAGVITKPFSPARLRELLTHDSSADANGSTLQIDPDAAEATDEITADALSQAIDNNELLMMYQPKVHCLDGQLAGFEALVRWHCPRRGVLFPDQFIPIAEVNGLMGKMTRRVIEQSMGWFSTHLIQPDDHEPNSDESQDFLRTLTLSINLSARSLSDPDLLDFVIEQHRRHKLRPHQLIFELTETSTMEDPIGSLDLLTRLRVKGFQLSIDDFGTGYSSMVQLVRLPFSEIKVDKSFVMASGRSEEARAVIRSIVQLGHSLGLMTTAEGVEDSDTMDYLNQIGCDCAQGYYVSRPMEGQAAREWSRKHLSSWRTAD